MSFTDHIAAMDRAIQEHLGGVVASYQPILGPAVPVTGMFDENYVFVDSAGGGVEQIGPAFFARLAVLPAHPESDEPTLTIGGTAYKVHRRHTDGSAGGGVVLRLHRSL